MNSSDETKTKPASSGPEVTALLIEQRDLYRQLSRLSDKQRGSITGDEPERLLAILGERQQLIDRLEAVGRRLRPYQVNWRQLREGLNEDDGRQVDGLVTQVNAILSEILKKDEADAAMLSARKGETGRAIGVLQAGRQAGRVYGASYATHGRGADWTEA